MAIQIIREQPGTTINGWWVLPTLLLVMPVSFGGMMVGATLSDHHPGLGALVALGSAAVFFLNFFCMKGLFVVHPNRARVLQLFGSYRGTVRETGLRFTNPLYTKTQVSVRVRNFESEQLKVNDSGGQPGRHRSGGRVARERHRRGAVPRRQLPALRRRSVAKPRSVTSRRSSPTTRTAEGEIALRSHPVEVAAQLRDRDPGPPSRRLASRSSSPASATSPTRRRSPAAMLQRQQANAIVAAREKIVEGAVGMVETALDGALPSRKIVALDDRASGQSS